MTTEALTPRESQDPLIEDEKPRDLLAEIRVLLLLAHDSFNKASARRLSAAKKKQFEAEGSSYKRQADQLIAEYYGISIDNPDHHLMLVSRRADLRKEALGQQRAPSRASYEVGKKAYEAAKRVTSELPDAKMRAAHDID